MPLLNGLDRIAHVTDRFGQVGRQASGQQIGETQRKQRKNHGLEQDVLLALIEGVTGHPHQYPTHIVLGRGIGLTGAAPDPDGGLKHLDLSAMVGVELRLLGMDQHIVGAVLYLHKLHMGGVERRRHQGFEHLGVARNNPVLGRRGQLAGNQLAGVVQLLA